jgi:single-strand DNA-binding protein
VNEPATTVTGNLTADPELRYTPTGQAVASFTIASTPRYRDTATGQWQDGETWFVRCSAWRDLGENVATSLGKGAAVVASGRLRARSWETDDGNKRTVVEMTVDDLGPSLRRATVKVTKTVRERTPASGDGPAAADNQWNAPAAGPDPADNEPPF